MKEIFHTTKKALAIAPGTYKSGANPTGVAVDLQAFQACTLDLAIGAVTDAQTLTVQESDVIGSGYGDVAAGDVLGDLAAFKAIGTGDANSAKCIGYTGKKRFLKVGSTGAGTTGAAYAVLATLGHAMKGPAQT